MYHTRLLARQLKWIQGAFERVYLQLIWKNLVCLAHIVDLIYSGHIALIVL